MYIWIYINNTNVNDNLYLLRFEPADALVYTLIFNTTPVAFGALGIPVTTLATLTGLPAISLSAMMGRQLPLISLFLPAYALLFYAGPRAGLIECWPVATVAGISFALIQGIFANLVGPELPDLMAGLISLLSVIGFVQYWRPPYRQEFEANINSLLKTDNAYNSHNSSEISQESMEKKNETEVHHHEVSIATSTTDKGMERLNWKEALLAWSPWIIIVVVVIM